MRIIFIFLLICGLAFVQATWAVNWEIFGIVAPVLLSFLIVLSVREGKRQGIIWAFWGGLIYTFLVPLPFSGEMIAMLAAVGVLGILAESVFSNISPLTLTGLTAITLVIYVLVKISFYNLAAVMWGTPTALPWGDLFLNLVVMVAYGIGLVWIIYLAWEWLEQRFAAIRKDSGLKRPRFL